jgi:hypothetical protein
MDNNLTQTQAQAPQPEAAGTKRFVNTFAMIIALLSAAVLLALVIMSWVNIREDKTTADNIKGLFNVLLPVIGTWMGTLLAFYFSKDNFEAASKQAKDLASQMNNASAKLQELKVGDIMIKPSDSSLLVVNGLADFKTRPLTELIKRMDDSHSDRLPVLDKDTMKFIFLIYRTTIERFIVALTNDKNVTIPGKAVTLDIIPKLTMDDMYNSNFKLFQDIMAIKGCFIPMTATLDKVQQAMLDNTICQDVFITQTGSRDEKVEGWITNNMIIEKAELFKKAGAKG